MLKSLYIATNGYLRKPKPTLVISVEGYLQYEYPIVETKRKSPTKIESFRSHDNQDLMDIINIFLQCKN